MFAVEIYKDGVWKPIARPITRGAAMNAVDTTFRCHDSEIPVRATENGQPFYSREQGKSNADG